MGKHNWSWLHHNKPGIDRRFCTLFGIIEVQADVLCPPWSSIGEGESKTNRAYEAGELKEIKSILDSLNAAIWVRKEKIGPGDLINIRDRIEKLIQKHEGHEQS